MKVGEGCSVAGLVSTRGLQQCSGGHKMPRIIPGSSACLQSWGPASCPFKSHLIIVPFSSSNMFMSSCFEDSVFYVHHLGHFKGSFRCLILPPTHPCCVLTLFISCFWWNSNIWDNIDNSKYCVPQLMNYFIILVSKLILNSAKLFLPLCLAAKM